MAVLDGVWSAVYGASQPAVADNPKNFQKQLAFKMTLDSFCAPFDREVDGQH